MKAERRARRILALVSLGLPLALFGAWAAAHAPGSPITVHGRVSADGGWLPAALRVAAGTPLRLRLVSDDVMHGFAIGHSDQPALDLPPGEVVELNLAFDRPGIYTFYCTRWCGPDHWRMRGIIEVSGDAGPRAEPQVPLYQSLGIDLDAPHPASAVPAERPSAPRGRSLMIDLPQGFRTRRDFLENPPAETWRALRRHPATANLTEGQTWDLVALFWSTTTSDAALAEGRELYARNCAACHGESGQGDGVMAPASRSPAGILAGAGHNPPPADFTDAASMLGASPAALHGKILRGGMGTGMPYWGTIFNDRQLWALTDYLWTFQFQEEP